ncbi:RagB/SusD family nutrient uptake outer membrane protein [Pedobacter gandavensis]|uniref:RagB/SusD family nutrient uptake outer membrane protein n=2 Tax=Pedobacter TaxID=84567 RepID=UPI001C99725C|nr:RagB/SusD family nutrient uptake outer membrane protein [Pedobacter gandavensis]WGQ08877.1 RagB/SusD family nutrient uptake outer membrane protein [Pedobacter gandavensis]
MKIFKIFFPILLLSICMVSCQKFLDIKKSNDQSFMSTASDCQLLLDNYEKMNTNYPTDAEVSADDYFISSVSAQLSSIPQEEKDLYNWNTNAQRISASPNWVNPYNVVNNANLVLQTLDKLKGGNDDPALLNALRGAALFYRAYCFWTVAQMYAKPYSTNTANQDPGIPLRLDPDINGKSTRGTVQETYNRIIQDLKEALSLLPNTSAYTTRPNKIAAYAMLARTYLSMQDYPNALINANAALEIKKDLLDYNTISKSSPVPFARFNKEVIFHTISRYSANAVGAILVIGNVLPNSCIARINPDLVDSYATNDLRRSIFLKENSISVSLDNGSGGKTPVTFPDGTFRFSGNYEPFVLPTFFTGLAVDEILLIRSECYARAGNIALAANDLNYLLTTRYATNSYVNMSAQTPPDVALNTILTERRKELLMRGLRWSDLRRLNKAAIRKTKDVTFTGTTTTPVKVENISTSTLPANDPRFTLLIPKEVMDNSSIPQNNR